MENETKYRVAIVGCGVISGTHIPLLKKEKYAQLIALCDIDTDAAYQKCKQYGLNLPVYSDYVQMLDREQPDAVHILTPHYLHAPMALAAIERGIHVCLEKPIAITEADAEKIMERAKQKGVTVCVCYQNRFNPQVLYAKRIVEEDAGVEAAYATVIWNRDEGYYKSDPWRGRLATEGGGVLINQAIHAIDLLCFFSGKTEFLCGNISNHHLKDIIEVEDSAMATITFEGGTVANLYATTAHGGRDEIEIFLRTKNHTLRIFADDLLLDGERVSFQVESAYGTKPCYGAGHGPLIHAFYSALRDGAPSPIDLESALPSLKIIRAIYRSNGERVILS